MPVFPSRIPRRLSRLLALLALALPLATPSARSQDAPPQTLRKVADDLVLPLIVTSLDKQQLLVADQVGLVYVVGQDGKRRAEPFLDLRPKLTKLNDGFDERGLIGLALHPRFAENRKLFVYYSAPRRTTCPTNWDHTSHLSEFTATPDKSKVELGTERLLLEIDKPYFNHNGGRMAFGSDGLLYFGTGDGGNMNDEGFDRAPTGNAQDLTTLLGKILRIDVDHPANGKPYGIPTDNPVVGRKAVHPEIYAWGIRNPWGLSFDRGGNHELFVSDVGQNRFEEVNIIRRGGNYGWRQREGRHPFDPKKPSEINAPEVMEPSDRDAFVDPILEYKNVNTFAKDPEAHGISVTGGFVYRGKALPKLAGNYIFGDWSRQFARPDGRLLVGTPPAAGSKNWSLAPLPVASHPNLALGMYIVAFGEDSDGEIYVLTTQQGGLVGRTGVVWKLVPAGGS